jgi:hypothetical protein
MKLNERKIIDLRNLRRKNRLNEKTASDNAKVIRCENHEEMIAAIHYMLNIIQKDLMITEVVGEVMDFEEIYEKSKEKN